MERMRITSLFIIFALVAGRAVAEERRKPQPFQPDAEFWLEAAVDDIEQGMLYEAHRAATEAIHLNEARGYYVRAIVSFKKNEANKALSDINKCLEIEKDAEVRAAALYFRAITHLILKHPEKAVADCDRLIANGSDDADHYQLRSACHWALQDWDHAVADAVRMIDAKPDDHEGYYLRARIRAMQKQYRLAVIDFRRAADLCNDDMEFVVLVAALVTCPTKEFNDYDGAIDLVRRRCESTKWNGCFWISLLGAVYAEAGDFSRAVEYAKRATCLTVEDDSALATRNLQLFKAGKTLSVFSKHDMWTDAAVSPPAIPKASGD